MTIGTLVDTKEDAKRLRREFKKAFPKDQITYTKTNHGYYWVNHIPSWTKESHDIKPEVKP